MFRPTSSANGRRSAIAPLSSGGATGMRMAPTEAVEPIEFVPQARRGRRAVAARAASACAGPAARCASAAGSATGFIGRYARPAPRPQVAAQYLAALATEIDVGDVAPGDSFDLVLGRNRELLYAGLDRVGDSGTAAGAVGRRTAAANGSTPPTRRGPRRSKAA